MIASSVAGDSAARSEALASSCQCRALALQFQLRAPHYVSAATSSTRRRSPGVFLLLAPAESSISALSAGFMLPSAVMDMSARIPCLAAMSLSARANDSPAEKNLSALEKSSLHIFRPAHTASNKQRLPFSRAEEDYGRSRASSSMPETSPGRRKTDYGSSFGDADELDDVSVWDSNAEGIRRSWTTSRTSYVGSRPAEEQPDGYVPDAGNSWQWWRSGPDDDDYEGDTDDDEEEDSIFSWFDLDNFDVLSAFSMLRWMLPAAALFLPWLFGGPTFLMMAFALFPVAQKLFGLLLPSAWKATVQGWNSSSSKSRQRQGKRSRFSSRRNGTSSEFWTQTNNPPFVGSREESDVFNPNNGDWESSFLRNSVNQGPASKLGGWDEEDENYLIRKNVTRGKKKTALERRRNRKEVPLFFRLLVALFPFLRSWGGFL